jgi:opacity protein-like surface antigen
MPAIIARSAVLAAFVFACGVLPAAAQSSDETAWRASLYLWVPSVKATIGQSVPEGDIAGDVSSGDYLSHLKSAFLGTLEARKGRCSLFVDTIYLNVGDLKTTITSISGPGGNIALPVNRNAGSNLKAFVGTVVAGYALDASRDTTMDAFVGTRYVRLDTRLDWEFTTPAGNFPLRGSAESTKDIWDAIVGIRGRTALGGKWFAPYWLDAGAGDSRLTWQAMAGLGYALDWGDVVVAYRYAAYKFRGDQPASDMSFNGVLAGVSLRF